MFRFGFVYLLLYYLPFPLGQIARLQMVFVPFRWIGAGAGALVGWFMEGEQAATVWFGEHVLRLKPGAIVIQMTGSGDTLLAYVQAAMQCVVALLATGVWSAIARKRGSHERLAGLMRVYLRYALASIMLGYGLAKVPPMQFSPPGPDRLMRTFGDSSPMGLLWTFMGFSPAYTVFAGLAEVLGAVLLLWRRTTNLGAIVLIGVLLNVVMLNFCYDVPVKLFSLHLLATAVVVLLPSLPRIFNAMVLNRATMPEVFRWSQGSRWKRRGLCVVKYAFVVWMLGMGVFGAYRGWEQRRFTRSQSTLFGLYDVKHFELSGETRPPLTTDAQRWRRIAFTEWGAAIVLDMTDKRERMMVTHDSAAGTVKLQTVGPGAKDFLLKCEMPTEGELVLDGPFKDGPVHIVLQRVPLSAMTLTGRGFHWIQELPFNR